MELFTPSIAIVTQLKKLHHFSHLALETSLQCNCSSKYNAGYILIWKIQWVFWYISKKKKLACDYDTVDKISWEATPFSYTARHNCSSCSSKHKLKEPKWIFRMFHLITEKLTSSNKTISSFSISNCPSKCPIRYTWKSQKMTKGQYVFLATNGSILLWKLFWPTVRKKYSSDR